MFTGWKLTIVAMVMCGIIDDPDFLIYLTMELTPWVIKQESCILVKVCDISLSRYCASSRKPIPWDFTVMSLPNVMTKSIAKALFIWICASFATCHSVRCHHLASKNPIIVWTIAKMIREGNSIFRLKKLFLADSRWKERWPCDQQKYAVIIVWTLWLAVSLSFMIRVNVWYI